MEIKITTTITTTTTIIADIGEVIEEDIKIMTTIIIKIVHSLIIITEIKINTNEDQTEIITRSFREMNNKIIEETKIVMISFREMIIIEMIITIIINTEIIEMRIKIIMVILDTIIEINTIKTTEETIQMIKI
jgi:hypothetical protein